MADRDSNLPIRRYSSRREPLDTAFLTKRLAGARSYDRIAGYFTSSLLEVAGEAVESVVGPIRVVCNSDLAAIDVATARAAQMGLRRSWSAAEPERLLEGGSAAGARARLLRLHDLLASGKLQVRVLPDAVFGLIHGKAGVITLSDGNRTAFLGSVNESKAGWRLNYELIWEDRSEDAVAWVQEEFDALWQSPHAVPLAQFVIDDCARLAGRRVIASIAEWKSPEAEATGPNPAAAVVEAPVYRRELGLWEHQKAFVKWVFDAHHGAGGQARFILADQVGLGKTLQLAISALLIALGGERPVLVVCPRTLVWQWQNEMRDLLAMPSAVWCGRQWVDEQGIEHPGLGAEAITNCPRRVGIVSSGLATRGSEAAEYLLNLKYDCVILDEAHRARRRNLGEGRDGEAPDPNNLLRFMYRLAERTRSLLLATATPVQLRPIEAWDLLDVLSRGDDSVLGNAFSLWRKPEPALALIMGRSAPPEAEAERWEWVRNPMPPASEHRDFEILRGRLNLPDERAVVPGDALSALTIPDRARMEKLFPRFTQEHHPFIRRIVRRTREQLEQQIDPETGEPLLRRIGVELYGEDPAGAVELPSYLHEAYELAEEFCAMLGERIKGSGFLKTLLLRRVGSSIVAGYKTARKMLDSWEAIEGEDDENEDSDMVTPDAEGAAALSRTLTSEERGLLARFVAALEANRDRDPKYQVVCDILLQRGWLDSGCIVFSQYTDTIEWLAEQLSRELGDELIAVYSGSNRSGTIQGGTFQRRSREELKQLVQAGRVRLMLGTDAASEGLNLQRLATLINLDLPWNPTRLEQRKGRIQRIGQVHDVVKVYNLRYRGSVEDRVHELLSSRLKEIHTLFGQVPDVLEDAWVAVALGEKDRAKKIIDGLPHSHPFEIRYTAVEKIDWESCREVLDQGAKEQLLRSGWKTKTR